jgi:hypothetical protein
MRYLLLLLIFTLAASCEKEEITQASPNPIEVFAEQLASPEHLDELVQGLSRLAEETEVLSEEGPKDEEAERTFHRRAEAFVQKVFQREELGASRDAVLAYAAERNLPFEEVVESISVATEKYLSTSDDHPRQVDQKGLPCYRTYKDRLASLTINYSACMVYAGLSANEIGIYSCATGYLVGLYFADRAYNRCVADI